MKKILIYSDCFIFGGSENVIENLLKSYIISGEYSLVFYYAYSKRYKAAVNKKFSNFKNIHPLKILSAFNKWGYEAWIRQNKSLIRILYIKMRYVLSMVFEKAGLHDVFNLLKLYRLLKKELPDVLYINNGGYPGARSCRIAVISAQLAGIKNILFNVNNLALPQKGVIDKWLDKKIDNAVKIFITASKAAKDALVKQRKFDATKCINIPNTILQHEEVCAGAIKPCLREEFAIGNNELIIGSAGLLTGRKGFLVLIEAIKIIKSKTASPFKVFIFGEGEQRMELESKIKEYALENFVILPGYRNNISKYIKGFDIFVCPSVANEDFPYVILEAMLLSKPVIATNIAGIPEQVTDNYNGYIVPACDANKLADAVQLFFCKPELIKTMGQKGFKRYSEKFNNNLIMQSYNRLFLSL